MIELAVLYEYGNGVEKDFEKAAELYQMAINAGDESAETRLNRLYNMGVIKRP